MKPAAPRFRRSDRPHGAFIYPRYSTDNQSEKSIEEQIADCSAYCHAHGLPVLGIYPDYAVSGMKRSRPQLDAMMEDFRSGLADTLIIYDQSRLSRDMLNWFAVRAELDRLGVKLISVTQEYVGGNLRDSNVLIQETIIGLHNQMHIADTSRKVKAALRYRAQIGQHTGGVPPLGYRVENKRLVIDETEAAVVRRIFHEYESGQSYKSIIDGLNRDGIRTKRGSAFGSNSLHDLLKNPKYTGQVTFGGMPYRSDGSRDTHNPDTTDAITFQRDDLAIIGKEQFGRVQQRMALNKHCKSGRPQTARDYPLKGKVFCGDCGSAMTVARSVSKGTAYYYYRCTKKDRTYDCSCPPIRADKLEDIVQQYVISILGNADVQNKVLERIRAEANRIMGAGMAKLEAIKTDLQDTDKKIDNLMRALETGLVSETVTARIHKLEGDRAQLMTQLQSMRIAAEISLLPEQRVQELFSMVKGNYSTAAILSVVTRVEVSSETITIFTAFDPSDPTHHTRHLSDDAPESLIDIDGTPSGVPEKKHLLSTDKRCFFSTK